MCDLELFSKIRSHILIAHGTLVAHYMIAIADLHYFGDWKFGIKFKFQHKYCACTVCDAPRIDSLILIPYWLIVCMIVRHITFKKGK